MAGGRAAGFQLAPSSAEAYHRLLVPAFFAPCAARLLQVCPPRPGDRVLDLAGGTGAVAHAAAKQVGGLSSLVVVDVNPDMISVGSSRSGPIGPPLAWYQADAAELPLPDRSVDVAYCQQGLQFFADPDAALAEVGRVLTPGGRLGLAVWRSAPDNQAFADFVEVLPRHLPDPVVSSLRRPLAGPDGRRLRELLTGAGFLDIRSRIAVLEVRFAAPSAFFRAEVLGSPLAGPVAGLDPVARSRLHAEVEEALARHVDDDGLLLPMQTWLVAARRPVRSAAADRRPARPADR